MLLGAFEYGSSCDIWSCGCIIAELLLGFVFLKSRLMVGADAEGTDMSQLSVIFKVFGVPTEEDWEGVNSLPVSKW